MRSISSGIPLTASPCLQGQEDLLGMSLTRYPEVGSSLLKATKHDVDVMNKFRPEHPLTLQSARMLAQFLQKPEVPLRMMDGARSAMNQYSDPAQAMQHLLHGMYSELMVCPCFLPTLLGHCGDVGLPYGNFPLFLQFDTTKTVLSMPS